MSEIFTGIFAALICVQVLLKCWLATRQQRHIAAHRHAVPAFFASRISLDAHQKAADYNAAQLRLGLVELLLGAALLLGWTLFGGLQWLNTVLLQWQGAGLVQQMAVVVAFTLIGSLLDLPFDAWRTFVLEAKFGFNKTTWQLWLGDMLKGTLLGAAIGLPILALVLWLMAQAGSWWWLYAWGALVAFQALMLVVYPLWIAPLFNQFKPLQDADLAARTTALMQQAGMRAKGFFVMDGSRRSSHANAYFTGLGKSKRVVFYDTLMEKLTPAELDAVLAHELGHFKHGHVTKRLVLMLVASFLGFAALGWLSGQLWFYDGLGVRPVIGLDASAGSALGLNAGMALLLFSLVLPLFTFFLTPFFAALSRKDEFQADQYACQLASGQDLGQALLKLYSDNASTLTPDPWFVRFYASHPPAAQRLAAMGYHAA
jgi:STE24 endopeptidase